MIMNTISPNFVFPVTDWSDTSTYTNLPYNQVKEPLDNAIQSGQVNLTSNNTIILDSGASSSDDYYEGYYIKVTRKVNGIETVQERKISKYNGSTRTVTIDDVWQEDFIPEEGDDVEIYPPYRDKRVSINPAMQTMDYVTSKTYGKDLDHKKDLNLPSWLESGRYCDIGSDVTVNITSSSLPSSGEIYSYSAGNGDLIWQGTVTLVEKGYVQFTNNIGKLTNKWLNWKSYSVDDLVHHENRLYKVTSAGVKAEPIHTSGSTNGLNFLSSLSLKSSTGPKLDLAVDGNPIRALKNGNIISGYTLYDSDEVTYHRFMGWDEFSQRYVTKHQTNLIVDTSVPLLDNTNSFLEHFGGILRYSGDKYYLEVEKAEGLISDDPSEVRNITTDDIIGKIKLSDDGTRNSFNSLTVAFPDPGNKFESRNISFFNSNYLKADRNVPKKGNLTVPGITNYFNTRILADNYLTRSRYGLTVSFNMAFKGVMLLSGKVIQLQYDRYDWKDKKFRIKTLTHQPDATVDIVAEEYDDVFFDITNLSRQATSGPVGRATVTSIKPPTNLHATSVEGGDENFSNVEVSWTNNPDVGSYKNIYTELYSSSSSSMILEADSIKDNDLTFKKAHGLRVGDIITSLNSSNGLNINNKYFVKDVISETTITLSSTKDGSILALKDGTDINLSIKTINLIATLPCPTNKYVDTFGGIDGRVSKYYWVRHKVISK